MPFMMNRAALMILFVLNAALLVAVDMAVTAGAGFGVGGACLSALETRRFAIGNLPRMHALCDTALLVDIALHVLSHAL